MIEWKEIDLPDDNQFVFGCGTEDCVCHVKVGDAVFGLSVEEGSICVNCVNCGCCPYEDAIELNMDEPIRVRLKFVPECPNLGGWHMDGPCDCGWWWDIIPEETPKEIPMSLDYVMSNRVIERDVEDGGVMGDVVVCPTCTGDGQLHRPHELPPEVSPSDDTEDCTDDELNLSDCAYYRASHGDPDPGDGNYGPGTCSYVCHDEPSCITSQPSGGWPPLPTT